MDESLPELAQQLFGLAYTQIVTRHADQAWQAGRAAEMRATVEQVCADNGVELLRDGPTDHPAARHDVPRDTHMLRIILAASALWEAGHELTLLAALHRTTSPQHPKHPPQPTGPAS